MTMPPSAVVELARVTAMRSPCQKSKRGAVVFNQDGLPLSAAWNTLPAPFACSGDSACQAACGKICVHAERGAMDRLLIHPRVMYGYQDKFQMLHVKVIGETVVAGGPPSCVACSGQILAIGLAGMWLYERTTPVATCQGFDSIHDEESCGAEAKHIYRMTDKRTYSPYNYYACDAHPPAVRDFGHDHATCLRWQIEFANEQAVWKHYTAFEFHLATLINLKLPTAETAREDR